MLYRCLLSASIPFHMEVFDVIQMFVVRSYPFPHEVFDVIQMFVVRFYPFPHGGIRCYTDVCCPLLSLSP